MTLSGEVESKPMEVWLDHKAKLRSVRAEGYIKATLMTESRKLTATVKQQQQQKNVFEKD